MRSDNLMISRLAVFLVVLLLSFGARAGAQERGFLSSDPADRLSTVPHDPAMQQAIRNSSIDMITVKHLGWTETLPSFARIKIYQITGRTRIGRQDPVYTVLSMMFEQERWRTARVLPVEHPDLLVALNLDGKWVAPDQIIGNPRLPELTAELQASQDQKRELDRTVHMLNAIEQVRRLGREMRVLQAFEEQGITAEELLAIVDDPEAQRALHQQRRIQLAAWNERKAYIEAGTRLLNRTQTIAQLPTEFLVVPDSESVDGRWVRPVTVNMPQVKAMVAGRQFELDLAMAFAQNNPNTIGGAVDNFLGVVEQSRLYPERQWREWYNYYVRTNPWTIAAWTYLFGVMALGLYFFFRTRTLYAIALALMAGGFVWHTAAVGIRLYLTGHVPVSNMFESITFTSWAMILIAFIYEAYQWAFQKDSRRGLAALGAMTVGFLLLTGASLMPLHETRIHPLRAVLNSYWLNIHVTMMLLSYAAFGIAAFVAIFYLLRSLRDDEAPKVALYSGIGGGGLLGLYYFLYMLAPNVPLDSIISLTRVLAFAFGGILALAAVLTLITMGVRWISGQFGGASLDLISLPQTEEFAYRLVQVGWPILTVGITLGAVWADTAWGRYWGWDPKETWAFITWVAYTVYLHTRIVMGWRGRWSAAVCVIGFIMVMITWWGVSYLPWFSGGLHSYASPN